MSNVPATMKPIDEVRGALTKMEPEFKKTLPEHVSPEKFVRVSVTAVQQNPDLLNADRTSLYGACMKCAQDGLLPDGREAALVIFGGKVQYMPMVAGILKKVRNSGELASIAAHVVHKKDKFKFTLGDEEKIEHETPPLDEDRGEPIGAYAVALLKDGSRIREVMTLAEIEKVRSVSRSGAGGPWKSWWGEMAKKTVIRRLSKRLPMSTDLESVIRADDEDVDLDKVPAPAPAATPAPRPASRMHDAIDAEVVDAPPVKDPRPAAPPPKPAVSPVPAVSKAEQEETPETEPIDESQVPI